MAFVGLGVLAVLGKRRAYIAFVTLGILAIPARTQFRLQQPVCETVLTGANIALSLTKFAHIVLFGIFFVMTVAQLKGSLTSRLGWAALATLALGAIIELEQGATRTGNCRMRDLFPDAAGVLIGIVVATLWNRLAAAGRAGPAGSLSRERSTK